MLIECKIRREGGTHVDLFDEHYHFRPSPTGEHVCEVEDEDARDRFLMIPDAYRPARKGVQPPVEAPAPAVTPVSFKAFLPPGASMHVAEMTREQLFEYAARLGMRKPHPSINTEKLRTNILMVLDEQTRDLYPDKQDDESDDGGDESGDDDGGDPPDPDTLQP